MKKNINFFHLQRGIEVSYWIKRVGEDLKGSQKLNSQKVSGTICVLSDEICKRQRKYADIKVSFNTRVHVHVCVCLCLSRRPNQKIKLKNFWQFSFFLKLAYPKRT